METDKTKTLQIENLLTKEEKVIMQLRALYKHHGYSQFKTGRFEEYNLYAEHKSFLPSGNIITFTDISGKLMALDLMLHCRSYGV